MDPLFPTLRKRKRYIAIGILSQVNMNQKLIKNLINSISNNLYGEIETAKYGIYILKYDKNIGIVRCWHDYIYQVLAVISMIRIVENKNINIRVFGYSGTIKSLYKKYIMPNEKFNNITNDLE